MFIKEPTHCSEAWRRQNAVHTGVPSLPMGSISDRILTKTVNPAQNDWAFKKHVQDRWRGLNSVPLPCWVNGTQRHLLVNTGKDPKKSGYMRVTETTTYVGKGTNIAIRAERAFRVDDSAEIRFI